jgi:hypothetical protein
VPREERERALFGCQAADEVISTISWARKRFDGRRRAALQRARRISSSTAQRTSIRFGSYTWNMQGELLP